MVVVWLWRRARPEKVAEVAGSYTGHYLKGMLTPKEGATK